MQIPQPKITDLNRGAIAKMLMQLFEHWQVSTSDQLDMLGLAQNNRAALSRYKKGEPISSSRDSIERAGHLLAIHKNLRLLFPHNRELAYHWMSTKNMAFEGTMNDWGSGCEYSLFNLHLNCDSGIPISTILG